MPSPALTPDCLAVQPPDAVLCDAAIEALARLLIDAEKTDFTTNESEKAVARG